MKIKLISTFSDAGYLEYGKNFLESCNNFVKEIDVVIYKDNVNLCDRDNIKFLKLEDSSPNLLDFKKRNKDKIVTNFRDDAVKFAHKVYATIHASQDTDLDYLIWLDSDVEIFQPITIDYIRNFLPTDCCISYLGRRKFAETGFLIFNMRHPKIKDFFNRYEWYYNTDTLYSLKEFHDGYVFNVVKNEFDSIDESFSYNISSELSKNHFNDTFSDYIMHFKGNTKKERDRIIEKLLKRQRKSIEKNGKS